MGVLSSGGPALALCPLSLSTSAPDADTPGEYLSEPGYGSRTTVAAVANRSRG